MKEESEIVKYRTVSITVYPWTHPSGRQYWRFKAGERHITRSTLEKAKAAAKTHAQEVFKGALDINDLTPDQVRKIKRILEADPNLTLVDEFLVWHSRRAPKKLLGDALDEFLASKEANRGLSAQNVKTLKSRLSILTSLRGRMMTDIRPGDLVISSDLTPRTRKNIRASLVTFFRWCASNEYLPHGEKTAAERIEKPITRRKVPATYAPAEMLAILSAVSRKFLPWVACGGFAGIRTDEMYPLPTSDKSPLDWSDFLWDRGLIRIRPETDKNGRGRMVPILPALAHWLAPVKLECGPLISCLPSSGDEPETSRIGALVGGWRPNALRHSFISYRAAIVGIGKAAMEAGNSESEAKKSYLDAKGADEAAEWFAIGTREHHENIPQNH